jgi:cytochrome c oxidase subunit 3
VNFFRALLEKPWVTDQGAVVDLYAGRKVAMPAATAGLRMFLIVVTVVFSLFIGAYADRMALLDWRPFPAPSLLWLNTALLILSSVALQWARVSARRDRMDGLRAGLFAAGGLTFAFLVGQILVWRQLAEADYFTVTNPAIAFFYLITVLHGLHLVGGLVAWGRTAAKLRRGLGVDKIRLSVELCAVYWHYLLLVWLVLFSMLMFT